MTDNLSPLLELRTVVLALGEAHQDKWWRSQFLSATGLSFLGRVFPRSAFPAAIRSSGSAAKRVHDSNIGKGTVLHLFRLKPEWERKIETELSERGSDLEQQFRPILEDRDALLAKLEALAGDFEVELLVGPIRVDVEDDDFVPALAAIYLSAFHHGKQVFPYLEEELEGV